MVLMAQATPAAMYLHRKHRFEILHLHGDLIELAAVAPWARVVGLPVVLTLHGGLNRRPRYRRLAARLLPLADGFIGTSPTVKDELVGLGIYPERIRVIPSGIETSRFRPATEVERQQARRTIGVGQNEVVLVSVGRLHPMKGYDQLIRALSRIRTSSPWRAIIVGDGPYRQSLERQASDLPRVQFVGSVPHEAVPSYLHAADFFVLPSVDLIGSTETTPTALLEAMACGLPVVCSDSGGMPFLVRDGVNGRVVPQGDHERLRGAIEEMLRTSESSRQWGERNADVARGQDWTRVTERVVAFYCDVLDRVSSRRATKPIP